MRNSVSCRSYNCCSYRIRRKSSKIFIFTTTQMKWKKKCFRNRWFFFGGGRCDGGCRYWICGKEQKYHSSWLKRTKTLTRFIEVDFIITMMSGSYILMSHLFSCKITACKATSHWRQNKLSATNVFKLVYWTAHFLIHSVNKNASPVASDAMTFGLSIRWRRITRLLRGLFSSFPKSVI